MIPKQPFPSGPLASARAAADLCGIDPAELDTVVRTGAVRSERIKGRLFINLDDAERAARDGAGKGADDVPP
jgi:hypothetical protein